MWQVPYRQEYDLMLIGKMSLYLKVWQDLLQERSPEETHHKQAHENSRRRMSILWEAVQEPEQLASAL